ncbi:MAG: hypothetical protein J6B04_05465 [Clostridia bacterium]|nr:hypothetical protein [Clostridia bacterium]
MLYKCEICGLEYRDLNNCKGHELQCREKHRLALDMAEDVGFMHDRAQRANFRLCAKVKIAENEFKYYDVINAEYVQKDNRVVININQNEQQPEQKQDTKKSNKKS